MIEYKITPEWVSVQHYLKRLRMRIDDDTLDIGLNKI